MTFAYGKHGMIATDRDPIGRNATGCDYKKVLVKVLGPEIRKKTISSIATRLVVPVLLVYAHRTSERSSRDCFEKITQGTSGVPAVFDGFKSSGLLFISETRETASRNPISRRRYSKWRNETACPRAQQRCMSWSNAFETVEIVCWPIELKCFISFKINIFRFGANSALLLGQSSWFNTELVCPFESLSTLKTRTSRASFSWAI